MRTKVVGAAVGVGLVIGALSGMTGMAHVGATGGKGSVATVQSALACNCEIRYATANLNLREGAGTSHAVLLVIPAGSGMQVYLNADATKNGFVQVYYNNASFGWVSTQYLTTSGGSGSGSGSGGAGGSGGSIPSVADADITGTAFASTNVNFRQGPGTTYGIHLVIASGAQVATTGIVQNGFRAIFHAGIQGWVIDGSLDQQGSSSPTSDAGAYSVTGTGTTSAAVNLRSGPSTGHAVQRVLAAGTAVELTTAAKNGFRLVLVNGTAGWVHDSFITASAGQSNQGSAGTLKTLAGVNFRSDPSTGASVYDVIPAGTSVTATGTVQNGFRQVTVNGTTGWIHGDYLG